MRILVKMTSCGIGDTVMGMTSVAGLRATTDYHIIYQVCNHRVDWANVFTDAHEIVNYDTVVEYDYIFTPHLSYSQELDEQSKYPRWKYYADACGVEAKLPTPKKIEPHGSHKGCIILIPFCDWSARRWPLRYWKELERRLMAEGQDVVILDAPGDGGRTNFFSAMRYWGFGADYVASLILSSKLVIGADTGITHFAGALGQRTIALCGPTLGDKIFGFYPNVTSIQGSLGCGGCYWRGPNWIPDCDSACSDLATILPEQVLEVALKKPGKFRTSVGRQHLPIVEIEKADPTLQQVRNEVESTPTS